jgi:hypothetical protein
MTEVVLKLPDKERNFHNQTVECSTILELPERANSFESGNHGMIEVAMAVV